MEDNVITNRLMEITSWATKYCALVEHASDYLPKEFVEDMLDILPRIYLDFSDAELDFGENEEYFSSYVDEDYYDAVRRKMETLLGEYDVYLETFEEDMKYSDTPVAASISESLADIFQPLYNFISIVRETDGDSIRGAYTECRENFVSYWAQTLCNVVRALNNLRYNAEWPMPEE